MSTAVSREIRLASRPRGMPAAEHFALATVELDAPAAGQVLVRNQFMSVDPYMRGRMNDVKSYVPPFQVGQVLEGSAVGEVVVSRADGFAAGDIVTSMLGWREAFVADATVVQKVDAAVQPRSAWLGVLGITGLTAWVGLNLADVKADDRVFISAAAGAVGSVAGQLAKLRGCYVVGSAGSAEKVQLLTGELGFDAAFNYRDGDLSGQLAAASPPGIDVYFDNVGGEQLEVALMAMRLYGRIVACGAISSYNEQTPPPGPRNLALMIGKRLTMKGFIVSDHLDQLPQFAKEVGGYLAAGRLQARETIVEGIANAPGAFLRLFRGGNTGKMVVRLG